MSREPVDLGALAARWGGELEDGADAATIALLEARVVESTISASGCDDVTDLAIVVRASDGDVLAGVVGGTWGGCCELSHLWVAPDLRRRGVASAMMTAAESEAAARGCAQVVLFSHDVQAQGFYKALGYECLVVLDDYPQGSAARLFRKQLAGPAVRDGPTQ